jgi:hypothetical protein
MMDSAGVFVLFLTIFSGAAHVEMTTQEFETHAMCKYAAKELENLYSIDYTIANRGYARVYAVCLPKEENND